MPTIRNLTLGKKNRVQNITQSKQGTYLDPASGGSTLDSSYTWALPQSRNFVQTLKEFKIYCTVLGTVKLKLLVPTNGGFNVTDIQTLTCGVGLNSFSVSGGTLNTTSIPANSLIAVKPGTATVSCTVDSSEFFMGYLRFTGDITGSNVITESISYKDQIQAQFTTTFDRTQVLSSVFYSDDCSGNVLPNYGINTNWTFSGGNCLNGSTGLAQYLDLYPLTNANDHYFKIRFRFTAAGNRIAIYKKPVLIDHGAPLYGTILEADLANNRLVFYASWDGSTTLPASQSTLTLTNITLTTGVTYELELAKDNKLLIGVITDTTNGNRNVLSVEGYPTTLAGLGYGRCGIAALAGSAGDLKVSSIEIGAVQANPVNLWIGDSISEGTGCDQNGGFAQVTDLNSSGTRICPEGGTLVVNCLKRLRHELRFCKPTYVVLECVNNKNSSQEVTDYAAQIPIFYQEVINAGSIPVFVVPTPLSNGTESARKETNRAFLLGTGYNVSRADLSLSTGNDGVTYNAANFSDSIHPNQTGHDLQYSTIVGEYPQLIAERPIRVYASDPSYDTDYKNVLNYTYTNYGASELPTTAGQDAENAFVLEAKSNGLWAASPVLFNHHGNGGWRHALVNLKGPSNSTNARRIGRPVYATKGGFTGDASRSRIDYRFIPSVHGGSLFTQNDAAIAFYNNKVTINLDSVVIGAKSSGGSNSTCFQKSGTANILLQVNQNGGGSGLAFASNYQAFIRIYRSASTSFAVEKDATIIGPASTVSNGLASVSINGLCWNAPSAQTNFSDAELHCCFIHQYSLVGRVAIKTMWDNYRTLVAAL